jgi:hypothetical protein
MSEIYTEQIWNQFDEFGLIAGVERLPGESNIDFRHRIINSKNYDSTKQGLINYISESLLTYSYNVLEKKEFFSKRTPLSLSEYQKIKEPSLDYYNPTVTSSSETWVIEPSSSEQVDTCTVGDITWSLWKQPDGVYDRIWTVTSSPQEDIVLSYMWKDEEGNLHIIEESSKILTWENNSIVEVYAEED